MADSKVSALVASDALTGTELFYADGLASAAAADVKVTAAQIKTFVSASPTLVTPTLGVASGTSLALGGATIASNALAVTGTLNFNGNVTIASGGNIATSGVLTISAASGNVLNLSGAGLTVDGVSGDLQVYQAANIKWNGRGSIKSATSADVTAGTGAVFYSSLATYLVGSKVTLTDSAGAQTATLTNAPAAGNPTKWIAIDDNGTSRKIPAW